MIFERGRTEKRLRVLYFNTLLPGPTTASAIVLQRHLEWPGAEWTVIGENDIEVPKTLQRIRQRVIRPLSKDLAFGFEQNTEVKWAIAKLARQLDRNDFDVVLTLAHGRLGLNAWRLAEKLRLPLATIFHDWWPELLESSGENEVHGIRHAARAFDELQRKSDVSFAVCEGMAERLTGSHNKEVLYPIPDPQIEPISRLENNSPLRVTYTGSLWQPYGNLIAELADRLADDRNIKLQVYGNRRYLDAGTAERMEQRGQLFPWVPIDEYKHLITHGSDLLIAVMGDDEPGECRMKTSFPSKVINYYRTGNATFTWAPASSSLGRFADRENLTLKETRLDAGLVAVQIRKLLTDKKMMRDARNDAHRVARNVFEPQEINRRFYERLTQLAKQVAI